MCNWALQNTKLPYIKYKLCFLATWSLLGEDTHTQPAKHRKCSWISSFVLLRPSHFREAVLECNRLKCSLHSVLTCILPCIITIMFNPVLYFFWYIWRKTFKRKKRKKSPTWFEFGSPDQHSHGPQLSSRFPITHSAFPDDSSLSWVVTRHCPVRHHGGGL